MSGFSDTIVMPMYCWTGIPDTFLVSATTAAATLQQANCNWFRNTCQWNESICTAHHQITYCLQCTSTIRTGMLLTNACKQLQWRSDSGWGPVVCAMRSDWQRQKSGGQTCQVSADVHIKGSSRRNADAFGWKSSTTTCAVVSTTLTRMPRHIFLRLGCPRLSGCSKNHNITTWIPQLCYIQLNLSAESCFLHHSTILPRH